MNARQRWLLVFVVGFAGVVAAPRGAAAQDVPSQTAFVLDSAAKTVAALDVATAKPVGSVTLQGEPFILMQTKDAARLLVLDRGPGKLSVRYGYHPTAKSAVTIIDATTMKVISRTELGWGLGSTELTPDGQRLIVLCPGYTSQKPSETLARELVIIDTASANVAGRLSLERPVETLVLTPNGRTALAFTPRVSGKKPADNVAAELSFIDLMGPNLVSTLKLDGAPGRVTLSPDGEYAYLLDPGTPSKKKDKGINGRLHVVSLERRALEKSIDAGSQPRGLVVDADENQLMILSDGPPTKETSQESGELRIIRGSDLASTVNVANQPLFLRLAPNKERLHVVGTKSLTTVDYSSFHVEGHMPLESAGFSLVSSGGNVSELAITEDGKRGFALYGASSKLAVLDLESHKPVTTVATGRGSVKFGKFMAAVALTALSASAGAGMAGAVGMPYYTYNVYTVGDANTTIALRPDGKFAYVLNTQTNDVTIVNTETGVVVDKVAGGGRHLHLMTNGGVLAVVGGTIGFIDTETQKQLPGLTITGSTDLTMSRGGRYAAALREKGVTFLDGSTGRVVAKIDDLKKPTQVVFSPEK